MSQYGYESDVHFAPMVKKYTSIPQKDWNTQKLNSLELLVCNRALLGEWKKIGTKRYQFTYQMQSAIDLKYADKPTEEREKLYLRPIPVSASYQLDWIDGRWKVAVAKFAPHPRFTLLKDEMVRIKRRVDILPNSWQFDFESSEVAKRKYRLMLDADRGVCKPFESK